MESMLLAILLSISAPHPAAPPLGISSVTPQAEIILKSQSQQKAAKTDFADPATAIYEYVRPDGTVIRPAGQGSTLNQSRAPPAFGDYTMPNDLGYKDGRAIRRNEVQVNYGPARSRPTAEPLAIDGKANILKITDPAAPHSEAPALNKANPSRAGPQAQNIAFDADKPVPPTVKTRSPFEPTDQKLMTGPKKVLQLEHKPGPSLPGLKPANFDTFGILDAKTGQAFTWEDLNKALMTKPDEAQFWSGRVDTDGVEVGARKFADEQGATTLEKLLDRRGIKMPEWRDNPEAWAVVSKAYAQNASGTVRVFLGNDLRSRSIWETVERPTLTANPKVQKIIAVDAQTTVERVIFKRGKGQ
jgi:hypothetical protein